MHLVKINHNNKTYEISCESGALLHDVIKQSGINLSFPCGGKGFCGKCKVKVLSANKEPFSHEEKALLTTGEIENNIRLACLFRVYENINIEIQTAQAKILASYSKDFQLDPVITERFAVSVDIGTTTVVMYLVDLFSGEVVDCVSAENAQRLYGGDVITRITYTIERSDGTRVLNKAIINQLNNMANTLCQRNYIIPENISAMSICANTTMIHFLLCLETEQLSKAPFEPAFTDMVIKPATEIGININNTANIYIAPGKSAYIGGDILAGAAACKINKSDDLCLFIDIGTNGEIALGNKDRLLSCATAAGPAFEGLNISCGMGGTEGAISKFCFINGKPVYETIGGKPPVGICGSGILDIVSALLWAGIIDETGYMEEEAYYITDSISVTRKDIREIQLAKAAVCAGIHTLIQCAKASPSDIKTVYIAGGFGNFMDIDSALNIGLIPKEFKGRIQSVGNSAGSGAINMIWNKGFLNTLPEIKNKMEYIELSTNSFFMDAFINEMGF